MYKEKTILVTQGPSTCPVCGAETTINSEELDGYGGGYYPWKCPQCGSSGEEHFEIQKNFTGHENVVDADGAVIELQERTEDLTENAEDRIAELTEILMKGCFISLCNPVHYSFQPNQAREIASYLVDRGIRINPALSAMKEV